jgi:hypothetical protein
MLKKKVGIIIGFIVILFVVFKVGIEVGAATSEPGSAGDPLITKSYLDKRLGESSGTGSGNYKKVTVKKNETLTAGEGTELILYSGNATVKGQDGLINLSSGELFKSGNTVVKYNIFLSPNSNCGIKATTTVTLYIKGNYKIG